jgi:glycosyltransferase involved in cell wall biosynthesis
MTASTPLVSVVMSVYNGADTLAVTMDSILAQKDVRLEFIVVNDGSTDGTLNILKDYAKRDNRVRVLDQENRGLTVSLIRGCDQAQGEYIARQDAGDLSFANRLSRQTALIKCNPAVGLVSCGTRFFDSEGEYLYDVIPDSTGATKRLLSRKLDEIEGPSHHGSTLFPKKLYHEVGGYRAAFYFAQDLDLWIRLAERGKYALIPSILYQSHLSRGSLSGQYRNEQIECSRFILKCSQVRRAGGDEKPILLRAEKIKPGVRRFNKRHRLANEMYFIGMCLKRNQNPRSRYYFLKAFQTYPLHFKSIIRLAFN